MKKVNKLIISIFLIFAIIFGYIMPVVPSLAAESLTHDYSEVSTIPSDYSYGRLFWTDKSQIITLSDNTAEVFTNERFESVGDSDGIWTRYYAEPGQKISTKITNCAVDKDGDMCDVIIRVTGIQPLVAGKADNAYSQIRIGNYKEGTDFILFWLETVAESHLSIEYLKQGTNQKANITKNLATIYDIDQIREVEGARWDGCEGFTIDDAIGEVYYKKGIWLIDTEGAKGVRTPDSSVGYKEGLTDGNILHDYNSAVVTEEMTDATFKIFYSGNTCGIAFLFASPYTFELDKPVKTVDKTLVEEQEAYTYKVTQYVPNNYYADELNFIDNTGGKYTRFVISDELDSNIEINGDITVKNESGKDVTSYFDIATTNNVVTATAKETTLSDVNFYAHSYTVNIPARVKNGSNVDKVLNKATTTATNKSGVETKISNEVNVGLKYKVTVNAIIDNGTTKINDSEEHQRNNTQITLNAGSDSNNTVYFAPEEGYKINRVTIDGKEIDLSDCKLENGIYSYSFSDTNIKRNIEHSVVVTTEKKDAVVIVKYIDEETKKELVKNETIKGKLGDDYTTEEKTLNGYKLIATPENAEGKMETEETEVIYYYKRKDAVITVNYIDENGNKISTSETITTKMLEEYITNSKNIDGYTLTGTPENAKGIVNEESIVVNYVYSKKARTLPKTGDKNIYIIAVSVTIVFAGIMGIKKYRVRDIK